MVSLKKPSADCRWSSKSGVIMLKEKIYFIFEKILLVFYQELKCKWAGKTGVV
jgi:hypothetical protein